LLVIAGEKCEQLMNRKFFDLHCRYIQADEPWGFVAKKRRNVRAGDPAEFGDAWIFLAMDAETKLVPSFKIGKRSAGLTNDLIHDMWRRVDTRQVESDDRAY
jgi:hypothetical protein